MYLEHITLSNFKGFERLELSLHPRANVLVGVNGSGKTSALDGLAVALGSWFLGFAELSPSSIQSDDVHQRRVDGPLPGIEPVYPVRIEACGVFDGQRLSWARELRSKRGKTTHGEATDIKTHAAAHQAALSSGRDVTLPVIAYYSVGRLWRERRDRPALRDEDTLKSRTSGYDSCLRAESDPRFLESWMRWRELVRLKALSSGQPPDAIPTPYLDVVQRAVCAVVGDVERFFYDVEHGELRVVLSERGMLPFAMLSDGYRSLITLAADLAWRAARLNPHLGADSAQRANGVVLIDELDVHLHPTWQLEVLPAITRTFPNLQFIITTHSPQIITSSEHAWLRLMRNTGDLGEVGPVQGRDVNTILREVMGAAVRPQAFTQRLELLETLIESGQLSQARTVLEELQGVMGQHDTTLGDLEWELHSAEVDAL